jgi:hypothetical protein
MAKTMVEELRKFSGTDHGDLCDAAEDGIGAGGGDSSFSPEDDVTPCRPSR